MKIAIATDAWFPQVNGVVRTLAATVAELDRRGYEVELITPQRFRTMALPGYAGIDVAIAPRFSARRLLDAFAPDVVHIPTEGPIGWSARGWCLSRGMPFTTAFHTRFPDYASLRTGIDAERFWPIIRRFHRGSSAVLTATPSLERELTERGFANVRRWSRGIDHWQFQPGSEIHDDIASLPRPVLLSVGRVAPEKNLDAFLSLDVPGSKVVVGDGPSLGELKQRYPSVLFTGAMAGDELASAYRAADCFVFPSLTDTFGLVVIEALACGVPVAGFPVTGPLDILGPSGHGEHSTFDRQVGCLNADLSKAIAGALACDRHAASRFARLFTWEQATDQFLDAITKAAASRMESNSFECATEGVRSS